MVEENTTPIKKLDSKDQIALPVVVTILLVVVLVGAGIGYLGSKLTILGATAPGDAEKTAGIFDKKTFPDSAEGILKEGGIEGEGSFHLERPGGVSQNVYVTSSTVDLSQYLGKKVKVWGQTFQAEKAGWLMDVGYVEVK